MTIKYTLVILILVLSFVFGMASVALAQEPSTSPLPTPTGESDTPPTYQLPTTPPATAADSLAEIGRLFAFITAWLTYQAVKAINTVKGPKGEDKARWTGLTAAAITAAIALVSDISLTYAGVAAGWLDKSGVWTVFLWGLANIPASWAMYQGGKLTGALPEIIKAIQALGLLPSPLAVKK